MRMASSSPLRMCASAKEPLWRFVYLRTPTASRAKPALSGILRSTACGRTGPTSEIASNTSAIFGVIFGAERFLHHASMPYLIDSDVLIDISRGKQRRANTSMRSRRGGRISQVSALELIVGARDKRDLANIDTFLSAYLIVPLRDGLAGDGRAARIPPWPDLVQQCSDLCAGCSEGRPKRDFRGQLHRHAAGQ